ncbi:asparagine synthase-related protein [Nitrosomonas sp. ANs5]|uniref:asparagine synthase-related protein n=1 Tax=Nitrosomonas sp. ANs5 TaxID=3423941 RepID=UPI003D338691
MTIFAGVFLRRPGQSIPAELINELRFSISRHPDDVSNVQEYVDDRVCLLKTDIGALGESGEFSNADITAFIAGDPILQNGNDAAPLSRKESLQMIAGDLATGKQDILRLCRGIYCALAYEKTRQKLHLLTDKLGVRPIYIWVLADYIIFSTALRILEAISLFRKAVDPQGVAEIACFGYPLSDRSPYENIYTLHAGEVWSCGINEFKRQRYWRWDNLPESTKFKAIPDEKLPERLYRIFMDAIRIRLRKQKAVAAFLSGGLDSRAVVAALQASGTNVFSANFSTPGSQDFVFSQLAAKRIGVAHFSHLQFRPLVKGDPYGKASVREWLNSAEFLDHGPQRPSVVWSGDGGSVGLGHVYLNTDIIQAACAHDFKKAVTLFMTYNQWSTSTKLFNSSFGSTFIALIEKGIQAEIESIQPADPSRIFYLFLLLNDQRRHMFNHFENMDLTRIEFEEPFYDTDFIEEIVRHPTDSFLYHNFYLEWLKCFPRNLGVLEVPWQAYPNHIPCLLPQPDGLSYQWDKKISSEQIKKRRYAALQKAKILLNEPGFSKKYLNIGYMRLFMLLMRLGKADRSYWVHAPSVLHRYWSRADSINKPN